MHGKNKLFDIKKIILILLCNNILQLCINFLILLIFCKMYHDKIEIHN